jgi:hypothetical protein
MNKIKGVIFKIAFMLPKEKRIALANTRIGSALKRKMLANYRTTNLGQSELSNRIFVLEQIVNSLSVELMEHLHECKNKCE